MKDHATYLNSTLYEQMASHAFISEVLQEAWFRHGKKVEVLRPEVDASGYDVVLECNGVLRYVQLKTSKPHKKGGQHVNIALAEKTGGCVVWLVRHENDELCRMSLSYRFFGGTPGQPLPSLESFRTCKRTTPNQQGVYPNRNSIRNVPYGQFSELSNISQLVERLFGLKAN